MTPPDPLRLLELRAVTGQGGGPEKTLLLGAAAADPRRLLVTLCFLRRPDPTPLWVHERAADLGVESIEWSERHGLEPRTWPALRRLVRERRIQIIHSHDYRANFFAYLLARVEPVVAIATAHGWVGRTMRERLVYFPADKRLLARFARVFAVSGDIAADLLRAGADPRRVTVMLNAIACAGAPAEATARQRQRAAHGIGDGERVIGSVGRLAAEKRFDLLIDAFAALHRSRPELRLWIAGEGPLEPALRRRAAAAGLDGHCRFLGYRHDVESVLDALDVYVQPSDREGSANAVLEAMCRHVPVVATGVGGTPELVRDGVDGLLVPPGDTVALARAIAACLEDPASAQDRARRARRRLDDDFSFDRRQQRLLRCYEALLARGGMDE